MEQVNFYLVDNSTLSKVIIILVLLTFFSSGFSLYFVDLFFLIARSNCYFRTRYRLQSGFVVSHTGHELLKNLAPLN